MQLSTGVTASVQLCVVVVHIASLVPCEQHYLRDGNFT